MDNNYIRKLCDELLRAATQDEVVAILQDACHVERLRLRAGIENCDPGLFPPNKRKTEREFSFGKETLKLQWVKCGKNDCPCRNGRGHGPYWYAYRSVRGKTKSRYIGKELPEPLAVAEKNAAALGDLPAPASLPRPSVTDLAEAQAALDAKVFGSD